MCICSNRFRCNCPHMQDAPGLGYGAFKGISFPANFHLSQQLWTESQIVPFTDRLQSMLPDTDNGMSTGQVAVLRFDCYSVVLLYTGNGELSTSASKLAGDDAPKSVEVDNIRRGWTLTGVESFDWCLTGTILLLGGEGIYKQVSILYHV